MHVMMFTLVIAAALVATVLIFIFWIIIMVLRGLTRLILGPGIKQPPPQLTQRSGPHTRICAYQGCKAVNPSDARFCRRCGQHMEDSRRVPVRRAAML